MTERGCRTSPHIRNDAGPGIESAPKRLSGGCIANVCVLFPSPALPSDYRQLKIHVGISQWPNTMEIRMKSFQGRNSKLLQEYSEKRSCNSTSASLSGPSGTKLGWVWSRRSPEKPWYPDKSCTLRTPLFSPGTRQPVAQDVLGVKWHGVG